MLDTFKLVSTSYIEKLDDQEKGGTKKESHQNYHKVVRKQQCAINFSSTCMAQKPCKEISTSVRSELLLSSLKKS